MPLEQDLASGQQHTEHNCEQGGGHGGMGGLRAQTMRKPIGANNSGYRGTASQSAHSVGGQELNVAGEIQVVPGDGQRTQTDGVRGVARGAYLCKTDRAPATRRPMDLIALRDLACAPDLERVTSTGRVPEQERGDPQFWMEHAPALTIYFDILITAVTHYGQLHGRRARSGCKPRETLKCLSYSFA